ncbi:hypothetical protein H0W26_06085 [Candidatus Dependentiae bacterium]|nr:hypothetical protein [Candidatus Dependentiae bacterium]
MITRSRISLTTGLILVLLCLIGALSLTFSSLTTHGASALSKLLMIQGLFSAILRGLVIASLFYSLLVLLSNVILNKVDLDPFAPRSLREIISPALMYGVLLGLAMPLLERFLSGYLGMPSPAFKARLTRELALLGWPQQLMVSLFDVFNKEVHYRLFTLPAVLLILNKLFRPIHLQGHFTILLSIFITALISGIVSLGTSDNIFGPLTVLMKTHILLLATIPSMLFGWLFCKKGFWTASLAHFITFIIINSSFFITTPPLLIAVSNPLVGTP